MTVTFQSRGRSQRIWQVIFDLGSDMANGLAALDYAHKNYAKVV